MMQMKALWHVGKAGFSSEAMIQSLEFLDRITPVSTAEVAISDHPHPKERMVNLQLYIDDPARVNPKMDSS